MLNFLKALALSELTEDLDPANLDTEGAPQPTSPIREPENYAQA